MDETERLFELDLPERGMGDQAFAALTDVIGNSRAQNGRFFGYVQGSGEPIAALGDLFGINSEPEHYGLAFFAGGCHHRAHRRSLAVRSSRLSWFRRDADQRRVRRQPHGDWPWHASGKLQPMSAVYTIAGRGVIYASEQVHMAVPKAVAMLGIGRENLHYVPCDDSYRMIPSLLERAIRQDEAQGREPIAVVASAGTVNTGSIDPLREIAAIARAHDLWMHVDGAYGALAAIAAPEKFDGTGSGGFTFSRSP